MQHKIASIGKIIRQGVVGGLRSRVVPVVVLAGCVVGQVAERLHSRVGVLMRSMVGQVVVLCNWSIPLVAWVACSWCVVALELTSKKLGGCAGCAGGVGGGCVPAKYAPFA